MINRLHKFLRATPFCVGLLLFFLPAAWLSAQPAFFNFSYTGPNTLSVGPTCSSTLQGNVPNPVVSSTVGATITMSMFDPVASMFQYNDLFTSGTTAHVYWFVKDDAGHSFTYEYFINFVDNSPPSFNLTGVFDTLEFSSIAQVPMQTALPVTDNCTAVTSQTFSGTPGPALCESGTIIRTWMATDANNNTATFTQTIIIYKDSLPPQITGYPLNGSAPCEQLATAYPIWLAAQIATFAATDASGVASLTNNASAVFPPGCKVPYTVRFKAVDNCQFQQNVFVTFSTSDTKVPLVVKPPKDTVAYCSQSDNELVKLGEWINKKAYSQAFDSCSFPLAYSMKIGGIARDSAQVVAAFLASFAGGCSTKNVGSQSFNKVHGLISVEFIVQDACGNATSMGIADFGAIDTLPPSIIGTNVTEQCGGGNDQTVLQAWINAHGNATVTEDCSNFTWTNFSFVNSSGQVGSGNFNIGPYPTIQANNCSWFTDVTFRATDDCGNSSTITLRWSIIDTQVPTFTGLQPSITVYCPNPLPTVPAATVSDNCDATVAITFSRVYKDSICDGSYTVQTTWTATDDCGNSDSTIQDIFVRDTTKPVFTLIPANKTFRCDTFVMPPVPVMGVNIMATDGCSPVVSITTSTFSFQDPNPDTCSHYMYDIVRTFTALDECGNTQTATQIISVIDNLGPVPGGVLDTTALCSGLLPFPAPVPIATDACSGLTAPPTTTGQTPTPGLCTDQYTIAVHWLASDVCGNTTLFNQLVHVIDTVPPTLMNVPPNITVECDAIPAPPETSLLNSGDNCDNSVTVNLVETEIRNPDTTTCAHWTDYIVKREWTATDNCGNSRTYTQLIQIEDTTPPTIVPPPAMMFANDPGDCGAELIIPAPLSVTDVCSNQLSGAVISAVKPLVQAGPGSPFNTPVASMAFQLVSPNGLPFQPSIAGPVTELRIILEKADAEGPTESFNVFDENNVLLGTANTNSQCVDKTTVFTLTANQLNGWLNDGVANFNVVPNGSGSLACNPVCPGGKATARLAYTYSSSDVPIGLTYTLDGGASQNFPPSGPIFLTTGTHTVIYTATDCAGNSSTSSMQITVNDTQAPNIATPANILAFTGQNNCESIIMMPFPVITENCAMSASVSLASAVLPLHFENDPNVGLVAVDISPALNGIIPNAVGTGILKIRHKGDNAQVGEFFNVYDEVGTFLDSTGQGTMLGECATFFETIIPVTALQINTWASFGGALGSTFFYLESNRDIIKYSDFVSNCAPLLPNGTDGISQIQVVLEYSYAVIDYSIKNATNQVVSTGTITGSTTKDTLSPGNYTVMYTTTDNAGLTGMVTFAVTVRDTVKPKALCQPTLTIFANPAGLPPYTLSIAEINNGSTDNCTPSANLVFGLSPNMFNCNQAGSNFNVTLTVTDTSGNSANCVTIVRVENKKPLLSFIPVCEGNTLQLFCVPPVAAPNTYTFQWAGPGGYSSTDQNPVVTTNAMAVHNGTYCVTITGATGCTSTSCIFVSLAILTVTPVLTANGTSFCPGQDVVLMTNSYNGISVSYQWLQDTPTGLVALDTTVIITTFTIQNLAPGTYTFYLKVFANGCATLLSNPFILTVHPTPLANAEPETQQKCEGESISLQSPTPPTGGLTYSWTGPNNFISTAQNPLVTSNAVKTLHEGKYILVTQRNGCFSNPDTVMVTVNMKPPKPGIGGNTNACAGQTVTLVCNTLNASQYLWTAPSPTGPIDIITTTNMLQIPNVGNQNEGCYSVIVLVGGCYSDASESICVNVHDIPVITPSSNSPICQDSLLLLSASFSSEVPLDWCWTFPDSSLHFFQNLTVPNGASGTYQVVGKTSFGCSDTDSVTVINVMPPSIDSIGSNAPVCCNGAAITLSATVDPPPFSYSWTGGAFGTTPNTLANPAIGPDPNCTAYNGQYNLVVKDAFGCPSLPATLTIGIQQPPAPPTLLINPAQPICTGESALISVSPPTSGATYHWNRPGNLSDTTTMTAWLTIPNAQTLDSGSYTVIVISGNGTCQSGSSNIVTLTVNSIPPTPTMSSNSPVCEGGTLTLMANSVPGAIYQWTGPGFNVIMQNPERQQVTTSMAGIYTLKVTKDGCSPPETSLTVVVVQTPNTPQIAQPPGEICIDGPVSAFLNIINPQNGMIYTWEDAATGIDLQSSTATSLSLGLPNVLALGPGSHSFRVFATTPSPIGCNSANSIAVVVRFDTIPADINAFAGIDRYACVGNPIPLMATPPTGTVTGLWAQVPAPPTVTIDNANAANASFQGVANTIYTFQWSLSNGACMDYDRDTVVITAQNPEQAYAGPDSFYCETTGIRLHATQGMIAQGYWTQSEGQSTSLGIVIDEPNNPNTTISGNLQYGQNYAFTWVIGNIGCGENSDAVTVYIYSFQANAGSNQFVCSNNDCTTLTASSIFGFESGAWTVLLGGGVVTSPGLATTEVCDLSPGNNIFIWTTNEGKCGDRSRDTMEVFYEIFPTANADNIPVPFGATAEFNVLSNDILPGNFTIMVTIPPLSGTITEISTGVFIYRPGSGFTGTDVMTYRICNTSCPDACSFANVTFFVGTAPECFIPTIITPNGDGLNDVFTIPAVCTVGEGEANLEVTIFNQWGDLVFHDKPYKNDWGGTYNTAELPAGTYYFVVRLNETDKPKTGFLLIQR